jgi:hypothetical protein
MPKLNGLNLLHEDTERFTDLDNLLTWLNLFMVVRFSLEPIFTTATGAFKKVSCFKIGQKRFKNNHLAL